MKKYKIYRQLKVKQVFSETVPDGGDFRQSCQTAQTEKDSSELVHYSAHIGRLAPPAVLVILWVVEGRGRPRSTIYSEIYFLRFAWYTHLVQSTHSLFQLLGIRPHMAQRSRRPVRNWCALLPPPLSPPSPSSCAHCTRSDFSLDFGALCANSVYGQVRILYRLRGVGEGVDVLIQPEPVFTVPPSW